MDEDFHLDNFTAGTHLVAGTFADARALARDPANVGPEDNWIIWQVVGSGIAAAPVRLMGGRGPNVLP